MDWRIILAVITFLISVAGILYAGHLFVDYLDKMFPSHSE
jgi:hypothetical protein